MQVASVQVVEVPSDSDILWGTLSFVPFLVKLRLVRLKHVRARIALSFCSAFLGKGKGKLAKWIKVFEGFGFPVASGGTSAG